MTPSHLCKQGEKNPQMYFRGGKAWAVKEDEGAALHFWKDCTWNGSKASKWIGLETSEDTT